MGKRGRRPRQLLLTLRKLGNTGNWKRKYGIVISVECTVKEAIDISQERLRYDDSK
jgi:hypothetical protein